MIHLNAKSEEFAQKEIVEKIIKKYSNFVSFPILMGEKRINTIEPLWTKSKSEVTKEQHHEFYRYIAQAWDDPNYILHYSADSPVQIRALLYFPASHTEYRFNSGRLEPGVNLYSRKVLIQAKAKNILPEFLRFVKGVVDSEDLPLNLSREFAQDDLIIGKLNQVLTRRILKHLADEAKSDPVKYDKWFKEFGNFIKEGTCTPEASPYKEDLANLLRFESSSTEAEKTTSLADYVSRMKPEQKGIYYLVAPSRTLGLSSPYYETFKAKDIEVLILQNPVDEFVMTHLGTFKEHGLVSVESKEAEAAAGKKEEKAEDAQKAKDELKPFTEWLQTTLAPKVKEVKISEREYSVPALIVGHQSASHSRMMRIVDPMWKDGGDGHVLEINPASPVIKKLNETRATDADFAKAAAEQVFDNALIAAGLLDDSRPMLARLNILLDRALDRAVSSARPS
jgi:HSP90 family molecular chaperone